MEDPNQPPPTTVTTASMTKTAKLTQSTKKNLLILNSILLLIGNVGSVLIMRLYYLHGGHRIWMLAFIQAAGWPLILIILIFLYFRRRTKNHPTTLFYMPRRLFIAISLIGVLCGLDNYLYSYGIARLPVSTYTLVNASRLVFVAVFAFILVKQKFTPYSINAVVLLTLGSAVLAFQSGSDRPDGETNVDYVAGLLMTLAASALTGLLTPLIELTDNMAKQDMTYTLVLEVQMVMSFFSTLFCTIGMFFNNDFQAIWKEADDFGLGKMQYYIILSMSIIIWQCLFLGSVGVIYYGSSLLLGVMVNVQIPMMEILAVIIYKEKFQSEKGVSLVLSVWGFVSYFYGEYKYMKKNEGLHTISISI